MNMTKKSYLFVSIFSSLLFALILVFTVDNKAKAQSLCNDMGCLWEETDCDLQPDNPNNCEVGCHYMGQLSCQATSSTECENTICDPE